jgi:peptidoglycan/LPS O-acetylase OafA/YrhL
MPTLPTPAHALASRLDSLDGLRAIAIAGVMLFHYTVRWTTPTHTPSLYPFNDALITVPAQYGWLGVQLFFIISGFVITLTLQRCNGMLEFAARRYSRLAPAMLFCSVATFLSMHVIPAAPFDELPLWFVSSITFLDPQDLNMFTGSSAFRSIDTAYWSLYVEVKFYLVAGLLYFISRKRFVGSMCAILIIATILHVVRIPVLSGLSDRALIPLHLPWFIFGVGFYYVYKSEHWQRWIAPFMCAVLCLGVLQLSDRANVPTWTIPLLPALFLAALRMEALRKVLAWRPLAIAGTASYSCYLLHQYIGVALLNWLPAPIQSRLAGVAIVVGLMALMTVLSILSFRLLEAPASRWLLPKLLRKPIIADR